MKILHLLVFLVSFSLTSSYLLAQEEEVQNAEAVAAQPDANAAAPVDTPPPAAGAAATETGEDDEVIKALLVPEDVEGELSAEEQARRTNIRQQEALWRNPDYVPYDNSFQKLNEFSKAFSNNQFRLALSNYQSGLNAISKVRQKIENFRRQEAEKIRLNEKWYWQKVDRKDSEERYLTNLRDTAKLQAVVYFSRSVTYLNKVRNEELRNRKEYTRLKSDVYRSLIRTQYDLKNYTQCIPILNYYLELEENEKEYPAHRYLGNAYAFQEAILKRNKLAPEDEVYKIKMLKNTHMMRAAELRYGRDSREYRDMVKMINNDEIVSLKP